MRQALLTLAEASVGRIESSSRSGGIDSALSAMHFLHLLLIRFCSQMLPLPPPSSPSGAALIAAAALPHSSPHHRPQPCTTSVHHDLDSGIHRHLGHGSPDSRSPPWSDNDATERQPSCDRSWPRFTLLSAVSALPQSTLGE